MGSIALMMGEASSSSRSESDSSSEASVGDSITRGDSEKSGAADVVVETSAASGAASGPEAGVAVMLGTNWLAIVFAGVVTGNDGSVNPCLLAQVSGSSPCIRWVVSSNYPSTCLCIIEKRNLTLRQHKPATLEQ